MRVEVSKDTLLVLESIELEYWVENFGDSTEFLRGDEVKTLTISCLDCITKPVCALVIRTSPLMIMTPDSVLSPTDWVAIEPGAEYWRFPSDLLIGPSVVKPYRCSVMEPGHYSVFASLLLSDTAEFYIRGPKDLGEQSEVDEFREALERGSMNRLVFRSGHHEAIMQFLERHPRSLLVPRALGELLHCGPEHAQYAAKRLILEFPESINAVNALGSLNVASLTEHEREKVLGTLQNFGTKYAASNSITIQVTRLTNDLKGYRR